MLIFNTGTQYQNCMLSLAQYACLSNINKAQTLYGILMFYDITIADVIFT